MTLRHRIQELVSKFTSLQRKRTLLSQEGAIELFLSSSSPEIWFSYRGTTITWPLPTETTPIFLSDLTVRIQGHTLGYIERAHIKETTAVIGHIAVPPHLVRLGIGKRLAKAYARQLEALYKIDEIIFKEDNSNFLQTGYGGFFLSLGAKPLEIHKNELWQDYQWNKRYWQS